LKANFIADAFGISGRLTRGQYWVRLIAASIVNLVLDSLPDYSGPLSWLSTFVEFVVLIFLISVTIKRLHDRGKSGWWLLLFWAIPIVIIGLMMALELFAGPIFWFLVAAFVVFVGWGAIEIHFVRGSATDNMYGKCSDRSYDLFGQSIGATSALVTNRVAIVAAFVSAFFIAALAIEDFTGSVNRVVNNKVFFWRFEWIENVMMICFTIALVMGSIVWLSLRTKGNERLIPDILKNDLVLTGLLSITALVLLYITGTVEPTFSAVVSAISLLNGIGSYTAIFGVFAIFSIYLIARSPQIAVWIFTPTVLVALSSAIVEHSILNAMIWLLPSLILLCVVGIPIGLLMGAGLINQSIALSLGTLLIAFYAFFISIGLFTPAEIAAIVTIPAIIFFVIHYASGDTQRVVGNLVYGVRDIAQLLMGILFANIVIMFWTTNGFDRVIIDSALVKSFSSSRALIAVTPAVISIVAFAVSYILSAFLVPIVLFVSYGALASLGVADEVILTATVMGGISGLLIKCARQIGKTSTDVPITGLYVLAILSFVIGAVTSMLSPVRQALIELV